MVIIIFKMKPYHKYGVINKERMIPLHKNYLRELLKLCHIMTLCTNGMTNHLLIFTESLLKVKGWEIEKKRGGLSYFFWLGSFK